MPKVIIISKEQGYPDAGIEDTFYVREKVEGDEATPNEVEEVVSNAYFFVLIHTQKEQEKNQASLAEAFAFHHARKDHRPAIHPSPSPSERSTVDQTTPSIWSYP